MFEATSLVEASGKQGQDRAEVVRHAQGLVAAVADGAGGTSGGDEAADALIMWVRAFASREGDIRHAAAWSELLTRVDMQISCANGETTGVVVAAFENGLVGASVGDSAAWLVRDDGIDDLTEHQVRKPLLGTGAAQPVTFERSGFAGTLLLASDGLIKYATRPRICECALISDLSVASRALIDLVRLKSGALPDDIAVVLCRWAKPSRSVPAQSHAKRYVLTDTGEAIEEIVGPDDQR